MGLNGTPVAGGRIRTFFPGTEGPGRPLGSRKYLLAFGVTPYLVLGDVLAVVLAGLLVHAHPFSPMAGFRSALAVAVVLSLFCVRGRYRSRLTLSTLDMIPVTVLAAVVAAVADYALPYLGSNGVINLRHWWMMAVMLTTLLLGVRALMHTVVQRVRARGLVHHSTLIVGADGVGRQIADRLQGDRTFGLDLVGYLDTKPGGPSDGQVPVVDHPENLARAVEKHDARVVIVGYPEEDGHDMVDVMRTCHRLDCEILWVPRFHETHPSSRDMDEVWGIPLVRPHRRPYRSFSWRLKRMFDIGVAGGLLLLTSPLMLTIAVAVKRETGGVFFRQHRVSVDGAHFEVLKFQSLKPVDETESQTNWNIAHDDRVGRVGRFIRAWSLDELPQLFNVLRGDMSMVGPRPERPHFVDEFAETVPRYHTRHRVPAGLTGWSAVNGLRGDTSIAERAFFDNYYVDNWSLWLDLKIVALTFVAVLRRTGG